MIPALSPSPFTQSMPFSIAMLFFRVVMGCAFALHGLPKIQNAFGWMGDSVPGVLQALAAVAEFVGGLTLVLGFFTPLAVLGILATMVGAMVLVHIPMGHPFVSKDHSSELAMVYLTSSLLILVTGPGRFALDSLLSPFFPGCCASNHKDLPSA